MPQSDALRLGLGTESRVVSAQGTGHQFACVSHGNVDLPIRVCVRVRHAKMEGRVLWVSAHPARPPLGSLVGVCGDGRAPHESRSWGELLI